MRKVEEKTVVVSNEAADQAQADLVALIDVELGDVVGGNLADPLGWRANPARRFGMGTSFGYGK